MKKRSRTLHEVIAAKGGKLADIVRHADAISKFDRQLREGLPPQLALNNHWQVANIRYGILHLQLQGASWATKIRFQQKIILNEAKRIEPQISSIRLIIDPGPELKEKISSVRRTISEKSLQHLSEVISNSAESPLRQSLERLYRRQQHRR